MAQQRTLSRTIPALLPTPQAADGERGPDYARQRERVETHGSGGDDLTTTVAKLLPTPVASYRGDRGEASRDAGGGDELRAIGKLLPTPTAGDAKAGGSRNLEGSKAHPGVSLTDAIQTGDSTTPRRATAEQSPKIAATHDQGSLFDSAAVETLPVLLPTPVANPENPGAGGELRAALVHGEGRRNETGIDTLGRPNHGRPAALLPTPTTQDAKNEQGRRHYAEGGDNPTLLGAARRSDIAWGVYEEAVRRWEDISGREAPTPTDEKGRLAPPFVEWMLGYPAGWFDLPDLKRTAKLRALGNSVQVQCGEVVGAWARDLVLSGTLG